MGVAISLVAYAAGVFLRRKFKSDVFNPLLIAIAVTILFLAASKTDYETYNNGAKVLSWLLTPATVALAIPLYEQTALLKKNYKAVFAGIISGVLTSLVSILAMAALFRLSHREYVTLLPKSITTAIGMGISEELGGYVTVTVAVIVITGVLGNIFAKALCKIFHITHPIAKGIAIGTSSHAVGTAKAMEMGEAEGAMSSLSIAVSGILTVCGAIIFQKLCDCAFSVAWPIKQLPLVQSTSFWGAFCVEKPADLLRFSPACGSVILKFLCAIILSLTRRANCSQKTISRISWQAEMPVVLSAFYYAAEIRVNYRFDFVSFMIGTGSTALVFSFGHGGKNIRWLRRGAL